MPHGFGRLVRLLSFFDVLHNTAYENLAKFALLFKLWLLYNVITNILLSVQKCLTKLQKEVSTVNRRQKKLATVISSAAVIAGLMGIIASAFLYDNGKNVPPQSSATPTDTSNTENKIGDIEENIEIYLWHDTPELSDDVFITLDELSQSKDTYINKIKNGKYDNLTFPEQFDFDVPEEIGRYQIRTISDYYIDDLNTLDKAVRFLAGDSYDENCIADNYTKLSRLTHEPEFVYTPITYEVRLPSYEESTEQYYVSSDGEVGIYRNEERSASLIKIDPEADPDKAVNSRHSYYLQSSFSDDVYTLDDGNVSITEYQKTVQDIIDGAGDILKFNMPYKQLAIVSEEFENGTTLNSIICPVYKSVPVLWMSGDSEDNECNLVSNRTDDGFAYSVNGKAIDQFYLGWQFKDYKTLEEYDKIIAPDAAAQLLSQKLAPYFDGKILGVGLAYYDVCAGGVPAAEMGDTVYPYMENIINNGVHELTPFWAFYMDFAPGKVGLVNCKTGEVSFLREDIHDQG